MKRLIFLFLLVFLTLQQIVTASTIINTTTTIPFYPHIRSICRDGQGNLHVVWSYSTTAIRYAKSTDNGLTWTVNTSFYGATSTSTSTKNPPHISCDENNITLSYEDEDADDAIVAISEDNGATWSWDNPVTSEILFEVLVERRGERIYVVYGYDSTTLLIKFINSTDGGATWGTIKTITTPPPGSHIFNPNLAVDGSGGANDKIYVTGWEPLYHHIYFVNSTDSGVTWGTNINIMTTPYYTTTASITFNSSSLYVTSEANSQMWFTKSTDSGISWISDYRIDQLGSAHYPSVTIDDQGYPIVFWYSNSNIVFRKYNGTDWEDVVHITNNSLGNSYVNTKYNFNYDRIEFVWREGSNIVYDYLSYAPRVEEVTLINSTPYTNATLNCSAKYWSLIDNGRIEFIWYKTNSSGSYLMNYNGSTANSLELGQLGYTNITIPYSELLKSDNWTCSVRAWNTTDYSNWSNSSVWTILGESTPPRWLSITISPTPPIIYSISQVYTFQSTWTDNVLIKDVILQFDGRNYSYLYGGLTKSGNTYSKSFTGLSIETHKHKWFASDTSDNWNSTPLYEYQVKQQKLPPTQLPEEEIPPPEDPTEFPKEEISIPSPRTVITLPETGTTIKLEPNFVITLYPLTNRTAVIDNITKIEEPWKYKILLCNQTLITSYEIEIRVDIAYFCANYSGYPVEDPTVNIFKFIEDDWISLETKDIIINTIKKIICGKVSSTPHMITGFIPTLASQTALIAIKTCNNTIISLMKQGIDVSKAQEFLEKAWEEYYSCKYDKAKELADKGIESLAIPPRWLIPISFVAVVIVAVVWFRYYSVGIKK
jgi:hypothetical protein